VLLAAGLRLAALDVSAVLRADSGSHAVGCRVDRPRRIRRRRRAECGPDFVLGLRRAAAASCSPGWSRPDPAPGRRGAWGGGFPDGTRHPARRLRGRRTATPALAAIQEAARSPVPTLGYGVSYAVATSCSRSGHGHRRAAVTMAAMDLPPAMTGRIRVTRAVAAAALVLGVSVPAHAQKTDVVTLRNGDRITGESKGSSEAGSSSAPTTPGRCTWSGQARQRCRSPDLRSRDEQRRPVHRRPGACSRPVARVVTAEGEHPLRCST